MDRDTIIVSADFEEGCVGVCHDEIFTFYIIIISILYEFINCFVWPDTVLLFCFCFVSVSVLFLFCVFCFVFCGLCFMFCLNWPNMTFIT